LHQQLHLPPQSQASKRINVAFWACLLWLLLFPFSRRYCLRLSSLSACVVFFCSFMPIAAILQHPPRFLLWGTFCDQFRYPTPPTDPPLFPIVAHCTLHGFELSIVLYCSIFDILFSFDGFLFCDDSLLQATFHLFPGAGSASTGRINGSPEVQGKPSSACLPC